MFATLNKATSKSSVNLFFLGCATLFLELVLIRYLAGNIWNLGYFPNLVLMAVFVGMGLGFGLNRNLSESASKLVHLGAWGLLLILAIFVFVAHPKVPGFYGSSTGGVIGGELFFTKSPDAKTSYLPFAAVFTGIVGIFAMISQRTARLFRNFRPLTAYTLDIAGSCCGILSFMAASFLRLPAWSWFLIALAMFLMTVPLPRRARLMIIAVGTLTALVARLHDLNPLQYEYDDNAPLTTIWSPYQKVTYAEGAGQVMIFVNGIGHQRIYPAEDIPQSLYAIPHQRNKAEGQPPFKTALIIGAGSGNDVMAALLNGAEHVDAVEIDPVIAAIGKRYNPMKVYQDPRVNLVIDDGRAFMTRTPRKYSLIIFALTDSLVKVSAVSQLRLENYLFTVQSVRRAYDLLEPGGTLVLYNYYRTPWLVKKISTMLSFSTGNPAEFLMQKNDFVMMRIKKSGPAPQLANQLSASSGGIDLPTDDWPFLYLNQRGIPDLYLIPTAFLGGMIAAVLLMLQLAKRTARGSTERGQLAVGAAFFLMGVAFLLLETKSVIQFSLLFGTTWINSSLVFLSILILVLAANWAAGLFEHRRPVLLVSYLCLLAGCAMSLAYPLGSLLGLESAFLRFVFASLLTFSPIFFANLIFSVTFRDQNDISDRLFAWNLTGAVLGGLLEYCSMRFGYTFLAYIVAGAYTGVIVLLISGAATRSRQIRPVEA